MDRILNFELLANPANWLVVWLMVAFAMIAVTVINANMKAATS
jgi:hypothetical protein